MLLRRLFSSLFILPSILCSFDSFNLTPQTKISPSITTPTIVIKSNCPSDMIEIDGDYCPNLETICLKWVDSHGNETTAPKLIQTGRCGEFKSPTRCLSETVHKHFCIDKFEWPNKEGQVPQDWMSWYDAKKAMESMGKRLCTDSEWTMAAEGPNNHPLPYGDGFHRDKNQSICNFDNSTKGIDVFQAKTPTSPMSITLHNLLKKSGEQELCVSDYGVHDMSGNVDEWVVNEHGQNPPKGWDNHKMWGSWPSGLKGGHIFGVRNASIPETTGHGPTFAWYESGSRACRDTE